MDNVYTFLVTIVSIIIGALITWYFAHRYYIKASKELIEETKHIRKLLNCIVLLESDDEGQYTVKRDYEGNAVGLITQLSASMKGHSTVTGDLTIKSK